MASKMSAVHAAAPHGAPSVYAGSTGAGVGGTKTPVGDREGAADGRCVGACEGPVVGACEGLKVGLVVGVFVTAKGLQPPHSSGN